MRLLQLIVIILLLSACSGSKKYFKAAEKLEKQGLVNEAAEYYLVSLQRKSTNVNARIKLKEVGQKYASNLASEFFRNYNTQQIESSLESFERLKEFTDKTVLLDVKLDYPKGYDDDYKNVVNTYCEKNYNQAYTLVNQRKFSNAKEYIGNVKKYNSTFKTIQQLDVVATCEPLYQSAIVSIESKNYASAFTTLQTLNNKSQNYKDANDLLQLAKDQQTKSLMLFEPKNTVSKSEKAIEDYLFNNFNQVAQQKFTNHKVINNPLFTQLPDASDIYSSGNLDLIQAIRKATGADYFYVFDVSNSKENNPSPEKKQLVGYQEVKTRVNDTLTKTEYKDFLYNSVKASKLFSFEFKYKLINAYTNQIVTSQNQNIVAQDMVEYNELQKQLLGNGNINSCFPYNPQQTAPAAQFNPRNWRGGFTANKNLKAITDLQSEAYNKAINSFSSVQSYLK